MKLIHISDIHINPEPILGIDPVANFRACLDHVAEFHADADRIVISGDLTHHGRRESYEQLRDMLAESPLQGDAAPRLLIGNHDDRAVLLGDRHVHARHQREVEGHVAFVAVAEIFARILRPLIVLVKQP